MTEAATTAKTVANVAGEIGKIVVKEAAITAAEVAGAVTILLAVGFVAQKLQDRKAKKSLVVVSE